MSKIVNTEIRLFGQNLKDIIQDIINRLDALELEKNLEQSMKEIAQAGVSAEEAATAFLEFYTALGSNAHVEGICNKAYGELSFVEGYNNNIETIEKKSIEERWDWLDDTDS